MSNWNRILCRILIVSLSLSVGMAAVAGIERTERIGAGELTVTNLIGEITVEPHSGDDFEVTVDIQGDDADEDLIEIVLDDGRNASLDIRFPLGESKHYVYPRISGRSTFSLENNGNWFSRVFGGDKVTVRSSGKGLELWADVTIRVPQGNKLIVKHGVGTIEANDLHADLELFARSGSIDVADLRGSIVLDTGSGRVAAEDIEGRLLVDTGSGEVSVSRFRGSSLNIDTGSGRVSLSDVDSKSVIIDTGSGGVTARAVGADEMKIDTGSGSVVAELERMGAGYFEIDTGSGSIKFQLPPDASADVEADTGSGGIRLDIAGAVRIRHQDDDSAELTIGGGEAEVRLDTGSGSISIVQ